MAKVEKSDNTINLDTNGTLALRYRPKKFEEVAGHGAVVTQLKSMIKSNQVPNAIAFLGKPGTGKTTFSRMLARYINCEKGTSCGKCTSCIAIDKDKSSDYMEVNCATDGGIDNIKSIISQANFQPKGRLRIICLDEVHKLSNASANALLKPVENPPARTLWVLATSEPDSISNGSALLGRCQKYVLTPPTPQEIANRLKEIAEKEKFKWAKDKLLYVIGESTGGQVRDAVQLLEKCSLYAKSSKLTGKKLRQEIIGEVIEKDSNSLDEFAYNVLFGIYTCNYMLVQKAILESDGEHIPLINKLLFANNFLLSILTIKGKHPKIWWTPLNRRLKFDLDKSKCLPDVEDVVYVYGKLNSLKAEIMKFGVESIHLMSTILLECTVYFEGEE